MKNSTRWILFIAGIGVLVLGMHYFINPSWPFYFTMGWRPHYFGPRIFPGISFLGLLIIFMIGFVLYKVLFRSSHSKSAEKDFCPFCGRKFERNEPILETTSKAQSPGRT